MSAVFDIEKLLACPRCKGKLKLEVFVESEIRVIEKGRLTCSVCHMDYLIENGIFYLQPEPHIHDVEEGWDIASFDKTYQEMGYENSSYEWRQKSNIHRLVTDYDYPKVKGRLLQWLSPKDKALILDVGAGSGYFIFEMMERYRGKSLRFVGIDVSQEHIKWLAYRREEERRNNILAIVGDARQPPFLKETFDIISCTEVLEHIPDKKKVIREMSYCLKSGGRLILSTPSKSAMNFWTSFAKLLRFVRREAEIDGEGAYDKPSYPADLKRYLCDEGFSLLNFELNVILPPQDYFSRISYPLTKFIVTICSLVEKYTKPLFNRFALHVVLHVRKE